MTKKRSKKLTKQEVHQPDVFIAATHKTFDSLSAFKIPILIVLGVALFLGIGLTATDLFKKYRENKASESLAPFQERIVQIKEKLENQAKSEDQAKLEDQTKEKEFSDGKSGDKAKDSRNSSKAASSLSLEAIFEAHFASVTQEYISVISSHLSTSTAFQGALFLASLYGEYNKWEKAQSVLSMMTPNLSKNNLFYGLIHTGLGRAWLEMSEYEKAIVSYGKVLSSKQHSYLHGDVWVKKGLSHEKLGQMEQAKAAYEQAVQDYKDTEAGKQAKVYLRYMKFKQVP